VRSQLSRDAASGERASRSPLEYAYFCVYIRYIKGHRVRGSVDERGRRHVVSGDSRGDERTPSKYFARAKTVASADDDRRAQINVRSNRIAIARRLVPESAGFYRPRSDLEQWSVSSASEVAVTTDSTFEVSQCEIQHQPSLELTRLDPLGCGETPRFRAFSLSTLKSNTRYIACFDRISSRPLRENTRLDAEEPSAPTVFPRARFHSRKLRSRIQVPCSLRS